MKKKNDDIKKRWISKVKRRGERRVLEIKRREKDGKRREKKNRGEEKKEE